MEDYKVYVHINKINGKRYYGITSTKVEKRWNHGRGYEGQYFYRAIQKHGWDNFDHIVIAKGLTKEEAKWLEIGLIREHDTTNPSKGYNITNGGEGGNGLCGELNGMYGIHRYGESNPMYGKKHSDKTRRKISEKHADMSGGKNPNAKAVKNKATGEIFPSCREAGKKYNVTPSAISHSIRRKTRCVGCYWEYVEEAV